MKRLLALVAMVILVATMLTACGDTIRFSKVVVKNSYTDSTPTFTAAEALDLEGGIEKSEGILVQTADRSGENTVYEVYNVALKKSVWKESEAKKVSYYVKLVEQEDVSWFYVVKTTTTENEDGEDEETRHIAMYDAEGKVIAEAEGKNVKTPEIMYDLVRFEGKVYRVSAKKASIKAAFEISDLKKTPAISYKAGDFYIGGSTAGTNVVIYNSKLNPVVVYNFPSYAESENRDVHVLSNGNVLVQYSVSLGEYAEEFDYIKDGEKYSLTSILIDADDEEYETIDLNFIVDSVVYGEELEENGMDEDLDNVALIYKIKNKMLDTSRAGGKMVVMSNKAKPDDTIGGYVKGMYPSIMQVAKNRWAVMSTTGSTFLLNHKGKVLGEVSNVDTANESFIVSDNKVYDWNLKMVLDMSEHDVEEYTAYENCIVMTTEKNETLLYANGKVTTLIAKADAEKKYIREFDDRAFVVCEYDDNEKFDLYNDKGEVIYSGDGKVSHMSMELVVTEDLYMILKTYNSEGEDLTYILVK